MVSEDPDIGIRAQLILMIIPANSTDEFIASLANLGHFTDKSV